MDELDLLCSSNSSMTPTSVTMVNITRCCKYSQVLLMMGEKHRWKHVELTRNNKLTYSCISFVVFLINFKMLPCIRFSSSPGNSDPDHITSYSLHQNSIFHPLTNHLNPSGFFTYQQV
jgi:hypothetical protein